MKALVFGEVLFDVYKDIEHIGGASFNFAVNIKRMSNYGNSDVYFVSSVGNDRRGAGIILFAKENKLNTSLIEETASYKTGEASVFLDEKTKVPDYIIHEDVAFDNIEYSSDIDRVLKDNEFDIFYFNILSQRNDVSYNTLKKILKNINAKIKVFDITVRKNYYTKEKMKESLLFCNLLKLNEDELLVVRDMFYPNILVDNKKLILENIKKDFSIENIALTLGKDGNILLDKDNNYIIKKANNVTVVDTVGAGDSFAAAFSYALSKNLNTKTVLNFAQEIAENVVSVKGALTCFDIESVLKKYNLL